LWNVFGRIILSTVYLSLTIVVEKLVHPACLSSNQRPWCKKINFCASVWRMKCLKSTIVRLTEGWVKAPSLCVSTIWASSQCMCGSASLCWYTYNLHIVQCTSYTLVVKFTTEQCGSQLLVFYILKCIYRKLCVRPKCHFVWSFDVMVMRIMTFIIMLEF
jgi:hypothetical protein